MRFWMRQVCGIFVSGFTGRSFRRPITNDVSVKIEGEREGDLFASLVDREDGRSRTNRLAKQGSSFRCVVSTAGILASVDQ